MKLRIKGFFVTWVRFWGMTSYFGGWHYFRRWRWTMGVWNRNGRGRHFES